MQSDHERLNNARDTIFQDIIRKQFGTNGLNLITTMSIICLMLFIIFIMLLFGMTSYKDSQYADFVKKTKSPMLVLPPNLDTD